MSSETPEGSENAIENQLLELAKTKPDGISNKDIQTSIPDVPAKVWTTVINKLLKSG